MQASPVARTPRKLLRFSVRGLILLVLAIGAALGWLVRSARIQREAVAAITKAGGEVNYNWEWSNGTPISGGKPWAPKRLVDLVGLDYFGHVTRVSYWQRGMDLVLGQFEQWRRRKVLKSTIRNGTAFTADLKVLSQLSCLDLSSTDVTNDGLAHLKGLTRLSELDLSQTRVTDTGLAHLKGLTNLSCLRLGEPAAIGSTNLSRIGANNVRITDAGLAHLTGLTNLAELELGRLKITDAGAAHLRGLTNLTKLDFSRTEITDAALSQLKRLSKLSSLDLRFTDVTNAGAAELQRALPRVSILR